MFGIWHCSKLNQIQMVICYHGDEHYSGMGRQGRKPHPLIIWRRKEGGAPETAEENLSLF